MAKTVVQKVVFKNATPKKLYELYMDSKKHSIATGAPAKLSGKEGGAYTVHNGYITGKNLKLVKDKLIVQTWRGSTWDPNHVDSTFALYFEQKGKDTILHMVHANVPDNEEEGVTKGWYTHYWNPWKSYLKGKPITKYPEM